MELAGTGLGEEACSGGATGEDGAATEGKAVPVGLTVTSYSRPFTLTWSGEECKSFTSTSKGFPFMVTVIRFIS